MTNLMTDKHIIHNTTCSLPHRKSQHTGMNIKLSSLYFLVFYNKIFGCQEFSKLRFDLVIDCHNVSFVWTHNTTKPA